jgi:hypothetical protein
MQQKRPRLTVKQPTLEPRSGAPSETVGIFVHLDPDAFRAALIAKGLSHRIGKWSTYFWGEGWPTRGRFTATSTTTVLRFPRGYGLTIADLIHEHDLQRQEKRAHHGE